MIACATLSATITSSRRYSSSFRLSCDHRLRCPRCRRDRHSSLIVTLSCSALLLLLNVSLIVETIIDLIVPIPSLSLVRRVRDLKFAIPRRFTVRKSNPCKVKSKRAPKGLSYSCSEAHRIWSLWSHDNRDLPPLNESGSRCRYLC